MFRNLDIDFLFFHFIVLKIKFFNIVAFLPIYFSMGIYNTKKDAYSLVSCQNWII